MKRYFLAVYAALFCITSPVKAGEPRILQTGDCIDMQDDNYLDYRELRQVLLDFGYTKLGIGGRYGSILVITALGADKNRYEIKVNGRTGEVVRVQAMRRIR